MRAHYALSFMVSEKRELCGTEAETRTLSNLTPALSSDLSRCCRSSGKSSPNCSFCRCEYRRVIRYLGACRSCDNAITGIIIV